MTEYHIRDYLPLESAGATIRLHYIPDLPALKKCKAYISIKTPIYRRVWVSIIEKMGDGLWWVVCPTSKMHEKTLLKLMKWIYQQSYREGLNNFIQFKCSTNEGLAFRWSFQCHLRHADEIEKRKVERKVERRVKKW